MDRATAAAVIGLCVYETAAMLTGRVPTVSALCRKYRLVEAALLAVLLAHLHYEAEQIDDMLQLAADIELA